MGGGWHIFNVKDSKGKFITHRLFLYVFSFILSYITNVEGGIFGLLIGFAMFYVIFYYMGLTFKVVIQWLEKQLKRVLK